MITKKKALELAISVLKKRNIEYSSIDDEIGVRFRSKDEMLYPVPIGKYKGKKMICI